jgi:hypothetical protein
MIINIKKISDMVRWHIIENGQVKALSVDMGESKAVIIADDSNGHSVMLTITIEQIHSTTLTAKKGKPNGESDKSRGKPNSGG